MQQADVNTKYTQICFHEEYIGDQVCRYAVVNLAWKESSEPLALAFSILMDKWIETEARKVFADASLDPKKDIYLEDTWLMINWEKETDKDHLAKILDVVKRAENRFDAFRMGIELPVEDEHPGVAEDR
jgi:hypothetical protein